MFYLTKFRDVIKQGVISSMGLWALIGSLALQNTWPKVKTSRSSEISRNLSTRFSRSLFGKWVLPKINISFRIQFSKKSIESTQKAQNLFLLTKNFSRNSKISKIFGIRSLGLLIVPFAINVMLFNPFNSCSHSSLLRFIYLFFYWSIF